jgi:septum site-determining protein MinC
MWMRQGRPSRRSERVEMTLLRGRGQGVEIVLAGRDFDEALGELERRLADRHDFYRGTAATAVLDAVPDSQAFDRLTSLLEGAGIALTGLAGDAALEAFASERGLAFSAPATPAAELERRRSLRPRRELKLSDAARTLVADFAGAREDIAQRRRRGETSVPRIEPAPVAVPAAAASAPAQPVLAAPETLYHVGTLRGGQALHHTGTIVVVGDVNPGAELVATGDIVVFGRLAGVAHAGAQGDDQARVYALDLDATQLRIATSIAADAGQKQAKRGAEVAFVRDGRIAVLPYDNLDAVGAPTLR